MFGSSFNIQSNTRPWKKLIKHKQVLAPTYLISLHSLDSSYADWGVGDRNQRQSGMVASKGIHRWNFKFTDRVFKRTW